jgi:hypothetical protein
VDASLEALWKHVLDYWDDEKAHGAFLEHCQRIEQLAEAAARYRGMKGDHVRGPIAEKRLAAVAVLALATLESSLEATRASAARAKGPGLALALTLFFATLGLMAYLWLSR